MTDISHLSGTLEQIRQLSDAINALEERRDALKQEIIEALAGDDTGTINNMTVVTYKTTTSNLFDQKRFREQNPELAKNYMRTSTYTSLRFVDPETQQ